MNAILLGFAIGMFSWALSSSSGDIKKERHEVKNAKYWYRFDPEIKSLKEKNIIDDCRSYLDEALADHMSVDDSNKTVYLYWDETTMNDDIISKLQDALASTEWKVEIVYNSIINEMNKGEKE